MRLNIYSDGGARGNPGPAAAAYLIVDDKGVVLKCESRYIGRRTNNQAEYEAIIAALKAAGTIEAQENVFHLDSELVCKHLTGEYRVKNPELRKLWTTAQELKRNLKQAKFVSVPRTNRFIQQADRLVNQQLDNTSLNSQT